jgi:predicted MPP superfamily phosphohydrolase
MTLIVSLLLPLMALWLWWPVTSLSKRQRRWHIGTTVALAVLALALALIWRSDVLGYHIVAYLQVLFGWLLMAFMLLVLFLLVRALGWSVSRLWKGRAAAHAFWHGPRLNQSVSVVILLLATVSIYNGLKPPRVLERELPVAGLPAEMAGLRVAVLSDLHASPAKGAWRTERIVADLMAAKPDMIVLPGDMVDGELEVTGPEVAALAKLSAPHGVWLAPGNHEYYHGYVRWMAHFRALGLGVLENQSALLDINGKRLAVSGIGDPAALRASSYMRGGLAPDLPAVLAAAKGNDFHLLLAHQPKLTREVAASGQVDLQISGHTHGGHIVGFDRWVVAPANHGFVRGAYQVNGMQLFVSSGAGQWDGFTARLGVPSAIEILTLQPAVQ